MTAKTKTSAAAFRGAPKWAKWAAKDGNGGIYWYALRPKISEIHRDMWTNVDLTEWTVAYFDDEVIPGPWRQSLRKRPTRKAGK